MPSIDEICSNVATSLSTQYPVTELEGQDLTTKPSTFISSTSQQSFLATSAFTHALLRNSSGPTYTTYASTSAIRHSPPFSPTSENALYFGSPGITPPIEKRLVSASRTSFHSTESSDDADTEVLNLSMQKPTIPAATSARGTAHTSTSFQNIPERLPGAGPSSRSPGTSTNLTSQSAAAFQYADQSRASNDPPIESPGRDPAKDRRRRQKLVNKDNLQCQVCQDKSQGYNFGALTCESCKAFFRRNAQKSGELRCNFDNNCEIDQFKRKFCTACRLKKCFDVGMKKEWILDEEQRKKRKKLTRRKSLSRESEPPPTSMFNPHQYPFLSAGHGQVPMFPPLASMVRLPVLALSAHLPPLGSAAAEDFSPQPMEEAKQQTLSSIICQYNEMESDIENEAKLKAEVQAAAAAEFEQSSRHDPGVVTMKEESMLVDDPYIAATNSVLGHFVKFFKSIEEYKDLLQADQITLLKKAILETMTIRSAIRHKYPTAPDPERPHASDDIVAQHKHFITELNHTARWDSTVMILLMIINLFCSSRPDIADLQQVLRAEQRYSNLLQSYLRSRYRQLEANSLFTNLLRKLGEVRSHSEIAGQRLQNDFLMASSDPDILMDKIFNIK